MECVWQWVEWKFFRELNILKYSSLLSVKSRRAGGGMELTVHFDARESTPDRRRRLWVCRRVASIPRVFCSSSGRNEPYPCQTAAWDSHICRNPPWFAPGAARWVSLGSSPPSSWSPRPPGRASIPSGSSLFAPYPKSWPPRQTNEQQQTLNCSWIRPVSKAH